MNQQKPRSILKIPPHNEDAEQSVLGSLLIDKNAIHRVGDLLVASDFYNPSHERIFEVIVELYEKHQPVDVMTLTNRLKELDILKDVGGSGYLADLTSRITTSSHVDHFAKIVKEKKVLRDLIRASAEITESAFKPANEFEVLMDEIERKILDISQKSLPKNFVAMKDELKNAYERIEQLHEHKGAMRGVATGFAQLDNLLSGLQKSDFIVLGARPSLGKTSLALDIAKHAAVKAGKVVGIFSLEMSREQVIDRLIGNEANVPVWQLRTGKIRDAMDFQSIQHALDVLSQAKIYIDDTPSPNILQMRSMARRLQIEHGLDLLIVDYLQLIAPRKNSDNVVAQVTEISRGLKGLARELNVPVLALSQLSRAVDQRDNKRPQLHDLRESGSIEQDADVVLFIYREREQQMQIDTSARPDQQCTAQIIIAKHRNGPLGVVDVHFNPEYVSFRSIDKHYTSPDEPIASQEPIVSDFGF